VSVHSWHYEASGGITSVAISADGRQIVAGSLSKYVLCLDGDGKWVWKTSLDNQAWRVSSSADGNIITAGTGSTRFWDMKGRGVVCLSGDGQVRWQKDLAASVWGLACSADGVTVAVGTSARQLLLFDQNGHRLWQYNFRGIGWYAWVWSTALSADGEVIICGTAGKQIGLFSRSGELIGEHQTRKDVFTVSIAANGTVAAAADNLGYIYFLNRLGLLLWEKKLDQGIWAIRLSDDGQRLLVGAGKKEPHIRLYDQGGRLVWQRFVGGNVSCLSMNADGKCHAVGTYEGEIYIFDSAGNILSRSQAKKKVRDIAISANGSLVVAGAEDGIVYGFRLTYS
jgi:WD40 repeat protein